VIRISRRLGQLWDTTRGRGNIEKFETKKGYCEWKQRRLFPFVAINHRINVDNVFTEARKALPHGCAGCMPLPPKYGMSFY
jgi:hypothetical protein